MGNVPEKPDYLTFSVYIKAIGQKKKHRIQWVTFPFALGQNLYSTTVNVDQWQQVVVPLNGINPAWQSLRVLAPTGNFGTQIHSLSVEVNDIADF